MAIIPAKAIDRRLLQAAAKFSATPNDLSEAVMGQLSPAQAETRLHTILNEITILDEVEQRRLILVSMAEHLEWMKTHRDNPKMWGPLNRGYKLLSDQVERTNINIDEVSTRLAVDHARFFVDAFVVGMRELFRVMKTREVIDIPDEDVYELVEVGVSASKGYIDKVATNREAVSE